MIVFGALLLVALLPLLSIVFLLGLEQVMDFTFVLRSWGGMLTLALGSIAMAALIGFVFLRTLLRPLQELIGRTNEIEAGKENAFRMIQYGGTREVATLGERFFHLARKLSDRSNYLTMFTSHVSHELKTPLTSIQGAAELLRDEGGDMDQRQRTQFLNNIVDDATRLAKLSTRLRELAGAEIADTTGECVLIEVVRQSAARHSLELDWSGEEGLVVGMSEANAEVVWQQLSQNAAEQGASILKINVRHLEGGLTILIGDDGSALSKANEAMIFDPFFTTRRGSGGTGMGLGIARAMMHSHEGALGLSANSQYKFELKFKR